MRLSDIYKAEGLKKSSINVTNRLLGDIGMVKPFKNSPIKIRKKSICQGCGRVFNVGKLMWHMQGCSDGRCRFYMCNPCKKTLDKQHYNTVFESGDLKNERKYIIKLWRNGERELRKQEKIEEDRLFKEMIKEYIKS